MIVSAPLAGIGSIRSIPGLVVEGAVFVLVYTDTGTEVSNIPVLTLIQIVFVQSVCVVELACLSRAVFRWVGGVVLALCCASGSTESGIKP